MARLLPRIKRVGSIQPHNNTAYKAEPSPKVDQSETIPFLIDFKSNSIGL